MDDEGVSRVANAFASHVIIDPTGPSGALRREATAAGVPTVTVEMGEAHRFQRSLIHRALAGTLSVLNDFGARTDGVVSWPGWRTIIGNDYEKTWLRADVGGLVEMHHGRSALVEAGERICTITNPFKRESGGDTCALYRPAGRGVGEPARLPGKPGVSPRRAGRTDSTRGEDAPVVTVGTAGVSRPA